jgi:hypothetical protein
MQHIIRKYREQAKFLFDEPCILEIGMAVMWSIWKVEGLYLWEPAHLCWQVGRFNLKEACILSVGVSLWIKPPL